MFSLKKRVDERSKVNVVRYSSTRPGIKLTRKVIYNRTHNS